MAQAAEAFCKRIHSGGGPLGHLLRVGLTTRQRERPHRKAVGAVFPLPTLRRGGDALHDLGGASLTAVIGWSNVLITILNASYMGDTEQAVCGYQPSVAQRRAQRNVVTMVASFVGSGVPWPSRAEISKLLQEADPLPRRGYGHETARDSGWSPAESGRRGSSSVT